ncbi:MAG: Lrp/AsnC family transcriptional regulator [Spirochaetales bacterium]|nr:Lrp/AsnC family transcriptional regulator [Spirochaetales bacterium]
MSNSSIPLPFDKLDYEIIKLLNENARMSAAEMEKRIGANQRNIRKRLDRLLDLGAIRLKGIVEPKVFGYGISVDIFLACEDGYEDQVLRELREMAPICYLATGQTNNELSIESRFQDFESMDDFMKKELPAIEGLTIKGFAILPRIEKNIDSWMPPEEIFKN